MNVRFRLANNDETQMSNVCFCDNNETFDWEVYCGVFLCMLDDTEGSTAEVDDMLDVFNTA